MRRVIGQVVGGRYQVVESLREGLGLFDVYLAREVGTGFTVVLKKLREEFASPGILPALGEALRGQARLGHAGVVNVLRHGVVEGQLFIIEDYFSRSTVLDALTLTCPALEQRLSLFGQVMAAIAHAHTQGVFHGALTPLNINLRRDFTARVGDWQVQALLLEHLAGDDLLPPSCTPWLAPETLLGKKSGSPADLYGLGVLLYACLSGYKLPFAKTDLGALTTLGVENYVPLEKHGVKDPRWDTVVQRCLSTDPAQRYASAQQLSHDYLATLGGGARAALPRLGAAPAPAVKAPRKGVNWWRLTNGVAASVLGFAILVMASFVGFMVFQRGPKGGSYYDFFAHLLRPAAAVETPDLVGARLENAKAVLVRQGFRLKVLGREYREGVPENVVLTQDPPPGKKVKLPRTVQVVLSGGVKLVEVPDLEGKTWEEAWAILRTAGLEVDGKPDYKPSDTVKFNHVLSQDPAPGVQLKAGQPVRVVLSSGSGEEGGQTPKLEGKTLEDARAALSQQGLALFANVFRYGQEQENTVVDQHPRPQEPAQAGETPVVLVLSRGAPPDAATAGRVIRVQVQGVKDDPAHLRVVYKDATGEHTALEGDYAKGEFDETEFEGEGETEVNLEADGIVVFSRVF